MKGITVSLIFGNFGKWTKKGSHYYRNASQMSYLIEDVKRCIHLMLLNFVYERSDNINAMSNIKKSCTMTKLCKKNRFRIWSAAMLWKPKFRCSKCYYNNGGYLWSTVVQQEPRSAEHEHTHNTISLRIRNGQNWCVNMPNGKRRVDDNVGLL